MIKLIKEDNITSNIEKFVRCEGMILKINIKSKIPLPNVVVQIENEDNEILFMGMLENKNMNIYPIHEIVQGDIYKVDKFYSFGDIGLKVSGLEEGQVIDSIKLFYEYTQIIMVSQ